MADIDAEIAKAQNSRGTGFGAELQDDEDGTYTKDRYAGLETSIGVGDVEEDDGAFLWG